MQENWIEQETYSKVDVNLNTYFKIFMFDELNLQETGSISFFKLLKITHFSENYKYTLLELMK